MRQFRVYLDASAVGGALDDEFRRETEPLFKAFHSGEALAVLSPLLLAEIQNAPGDVQKILANLLPIAEQTPSTAETIHLRDAYVAAGVLSARWADDAFHVAHASVARVDVIASWNFKHLVNSDKVRGFSAVNQVQGYGLVVIMTPGDVIRMIESERNEEQEV